MMDVGTQVPDSASLVNSAVDMLEGTPKAVFLLVDLLATVSARNGGQERSAVVGSLVDQLKAAGERGASTRLTAVSHLLAVFLAETAAARADAAEAGTPWAFQVIFGGC